MALTAAGSWTGRNWVASWVSFFCSLEMFERVTAAFGPDWHLKEHRWHLVSKSLTLGRSRAQTRVRCIHTLHGAPGVLARAHRLVADLDEVGGAHDREGDVRVHDAVHLRHRLVVHGELVDLHRVGLQLLHYFGLEFK